MSPPAVKGFPLVPTSTVNADNFPGVDTADSFTGFPAINPTAFSTPGLNCPRLKVKGGCSNLLALPPLKYNSFSEASDPYSVSGPLSGFCLPINLPSRYNSTSSQLLYTTIFEGSDSLVQLVARKTIG